ncbi:MAG: elongation factor G [Salibacteraceae bacterium]
MKVFDEKHIKNLVLLGSSKSGKTTLAETMLFEAGLINRRGTVEDKNTVSDYHDIEKERQSSVYATLLHTEWRNYKINIIDTPGLDDFVGEVVSSIRVANTSLMLINAQYGAEVGTDLIWNQVDHYNKPLIFAINQVDHEKSDFEMSLASLKDHYGSAVTQMQYPVNEGEGFNQIIDLLKMKLYKFGPEGGKPEKLPIPDGELEKANKLHNELVEKAAENDEALMELYFEKGNLTEDELREGLKLGMRNHDVFPVFCLSAKKDMGSGRLMGFIDNVAPSAVDMHPEITDDDHEIAYKLDGPPVLFVFKTINEPNLGKLSFFKVISGSISQGDHLVNHTTGENEHLSQLFIMDGHERNPIEKLVVGDIGATLKLKNTDTNHTLSSKNDNVGLKPITFPGSRISTAVVANTRKDDEKIGEVLKKISQEDPTVTYEQSKELKQLLIHCQGELHLSVIKYTMEHEYGMDISFEDPKIPYRETIQKPANAYYKHKKQSGGSGQFAEVHMDIEPWHEGMDAPTKHPVRSQEYVQLPWGGKLHFVSSIVGGAIDQRFLPAILKGIMMKMEEGPITGSYVRDVRVVVYDGKMHTVDSNEISFKLAGSHAFSEAFTKAEPKILEPIYKVEVLAPEDVVGDVMTDLQTRRAIIMGIESKGRNQAIQANIPLAEMNKYSTKLRSITHGMASFNSEFLNYAPVPKDVQQKLATSFSQN